MMWTPQGWYEDGLADGRAQGEFTRARADHVLNIHRSVMDGIDREEVGRILAQSNQERMDAVPDFGQYPELRGMPEMLLAEQQGVRDGAELDDAQAAAWFNGLFFYNREVLPGKWKPRARCSVIFVPDSDHGPLFGANLDSSPDEPFGPPQWPSNGNEHLVIGGVSSGLDMDEQSPEVFPAPVLKLVGRYCHCTDQAVEMLTRYNLFWGPCNRIVADRNGRTAMIEKTSCRIAVRWSEDGAGFVTAMTAEDPEMRAFLADRRAASLKQRGLSDPCSDTRYWALQDQRRLLMNRLMEDVRCDPTLDGVRGMLQYRGEDGFTCANGDVIHPGDAPLEHTLCTWVTSLSEGRSWWWARDKHRDIPSWENPQEQVVHEDVLTW